QKRIRLCNINALGGAIIMMLWAYFDLAFGDRQNVPWELAFMAGFVGVLGLNAMGAHRAGRLLLIVNANLCVFAGAVLFTEPSGGVLPFFAMAAMALLVFGPNEWLLAALGAALPAILLAACKTGIAADLLNIDPRPAPTWYFAANAATTFALAFLVPFFFFRSNLKAEAALSRMGQEKLKRVIDADLIGVVRGRLSGPIEDANDTFLSLLGYTRRDLAAGALDLRMIAPLEPFRTELHRRPGPASVYERTCLHKDGSKVPVLVGVAFLDESDDEVVAFVLDLTAQKHLDAQRALLHDSREALRLRDLFNSIASHELKTPLTALLLSLQLLSRRLEREAPMNAPLHAQVHRCESAAMRMGDLIHALLDVAQIHRGHLTLKLRELDIVEAVRRVASGLEPCRDGEPHRICVRADGPVSARLDPTRFEQIVTNLLSNAVKYGAGKPIEVRVGRDRAADLAHLEVIDHGPGIDPTMREKIFEPFERANTNEPIPGLGLGLYVVKLIVESHGGRIVVDGDVGQGARFIVDLPRDGVSQPLLQ
ncbi:MAG TPA: PAS domain-containing sensor histidine kinase, partial [Polyangia bacterium]|nr:PAS domain-containing sensor histidine kinase [Polyangia bacterium]